MARKFAAKAQGSMAKPMLVVTEPQSRLARACRSCAAGVAREKTRPRHAGRFGLTRGMPGG